MKTGQPATATANNDHHDSTAQLAVPRERAPWLVGVLWSVGLVMALAWPVFA